MSKPLFFLITSKDCGACQQFLPKWPTIKKEIERLNIVDIKHIEYEKMRGPPPPNLPGNFQLYVDWWPTFLLINPRMWTERMKTYEPLHAEIFNGFFNWNINKAELLSPNQRQPPEIPNLIAWIKGTINKPSFIKPVDPIPDNKTPTAPPVTPVNNNNVCSRLLFRGRKR